MALSILSKDEFIAQEIKAILKELMGDDYIKQLAKRCMFEKEEEDNLLMHLRNIDAALDCYLFKEEGKE